MTFAGLDHSMIQNVLSHRRISHTIKQSGDTALDMYNEMVTILDRTPNLASRQFIVIQEIEGLTKELLDITRIKSLRKRQADDATEEYNALVAKTKALESRYTKRNTYVSKRQKILKTMVPNELFTKLRSVTTAISIYWKLETSKAKTQRAETKMNKYMYVSYQYSKHADEMEPLLRSSINEMKEILPALQSTSLTEKMLNKYVDKRFEHLYTHSDTTCCICLDEDGRLVKLKCGHEFHIRCLSQLVYTFIENDKYAEIRCPMCRQCL